MSFSKAFSMKMDVIPFTSSMSTNYVQTRLVMATNQVLIKINEYSFDVADKIGKVSVFDLLKGQYREAWRLYRCLDEYLQPNICKEQYVKEDKVPSIIWTMLLTTLAMFFMLLCYWLMFKTLQYFWTQR